MQCLCPFIVGNKNCLGF